VTNTATSIAMNNGNGTFSLKALPIEAQLAPIHALLIKDFNNDENLDLLIGGNFYQSKPELGIYDASYGLLLKGNGMGKFTALSAKESGFSVKGAIRDFVQINTSNEALILVARNNDSVLFYRIE